MRRGRMMISVTAFAAAVAVGAPGAFGATPQQIYKDYADNGRLDGRYSQGDLRRALHDAVIQGYVRPTNNVAPTIKKKVSHPSSGVAGATLPKAKRQGALPFTGVDLALMTVGGFSLLLLGAALRRFARNRA
jgi:hypothetical protein